MKSALKVRQVYGRRECNLGGPAETCKAAVLPFANGPRHQGP